MTQNYEVSIGFLNDQSKEPVDQKQTSRKDRSRTARPAQVAQERQQIGRITRLQEGQVSGSGSGSVCSYSEHPADGAVHLQENRSCSVGLIKSWCEKWDFLIAYVAI